MMLALTGSWPGPAGALKYLSIDDVAIIQATSGAFSNEEGTPI